MQYKVIYAGDTWVMCRALNKIELDIPEDNIPRGESYILQSENEYFVMIPEYFFSVGDVLDSISIFDTIHQISKKAAMTVMLQGE